MKRKKTILIAALIGTCTFFGSETFANNFSLENTVTVKDSVTKEIFKVYGNCGMCEKTIEGSLKNAKGVVTADWNMETNMIEVTFYKGQITLDEIKKKIASVGYDTDDFKATNKSYNSLPGCCQYNRPE